MPADAVAELGDARQAPKRGAARRANASCPSEAQPTIANPPCRGEMRMMSQSEGEAVATTLAMESAVKASNASRSCAPEAEAPRCGTAAT